MLGTKLDCFIINETTSNNFQKKNARPKVKIRFSVSLGKNRRCGLSFHTPNNVKRVEASCWKSRAVNTRFSGSIHPPNDPWWTEAGSFVTLARTLATSASSFVATSLIRICCRFGLLTNWRHCLKTIWSLVALSSFLSFVTFTTSWRAAVAM